MLLHSCHPISVTTISHLEWCGVFVFDLSATALALLHSPHSGAVFKVNKCKCLDNAYYVPAHGVVFRTAFPENTKWPKGKQLEPDSGDERQSLVPHKGEAQIGVSCIKLYAESRKGNILSTCSFFY